MSNRIQNFAEELSRRSPGQVMLNEPLRHYTTYQVGGPARGLCTPGTREDLQHIIRLCAKEEIPFYILGGGSNILVHDAGLDMIVIRLEKCCAGIRHSGNRVHAGAGAKLSDLVSYCEENNLAGLDFMSGIPGTIGGALRMNAGAFVGEIGDRIIGVEAMTREGEILTIPGNEAGFGYRRADNLQDKIMLGCSLEMLNGSRSILEKARQEYLARRSARQPLDYGSCGSVFKRPPGNYAGTLIEQAGCKGMQVGGAMVSPKHANFIINYENATAYDIYELIGKVQRKVFSRFKIWLELEVKLVGFSEEEERNVREVHE